MKKIAFLTFLALAIPASAASIDWTMSTGAAANYMVDASGNKLNGVAYLVLTSDLATSTFSSIDDIEDIALGANGSKAVSIQNGVNKATTTTTDARLTAPTSYSFTILICDTVANKYYEVGPKNQSAYNLSGEQYTDSKIITANMTELKATAATRGTQTWVSVPEPTTAMLALAGLALLIKRRRA